jgi:CRP/FNR family cyclic AMP-dependent transcriptional regulator
MSVEAIPAKMIQSRGWLSLVPSDFRELVLANAQVRRYKKGEQVYGIGDEAGGLFGVGSGSLEVSLSTQHSLPHVAHIAQPGDWVGEASALTRFPRRIGARASRPTQLFHLPLAAIERMAQTDGTCWRYIGVLGALNTYMALQAGSDLLIRKPEGRCIAALLRLSADPGSDPAYAVLSEIDIAQQDLATLTNMSRNALGDVLRSLDARGLIGQKYRKIQILNRAELLRIVKRPID